MMNRKPMRRTGPIRSKPKAKRVANPLKAGTTGKRLQPKDEEPIIDAAHRDLVGRQPCIVSGYGGGERFCVCHHPRGLFLRTGGKRISDFLCTPLRADLHDGHGHSLHRHGDEAVWWQYAGVPKADVFRWIRRFLLDHYPIDHPGVVQAFVKMDQEESRA